MLAATLQTVIHRFHTSNVSTTVHCTFENFTALQLQMKVGEFPSSSCDEEVGMGYLHKRRSSDSKHKRGCNIYHTPQRVGLQVVLHSSTSTALKCQTEVGESSTSRARQDKRDRESPFESPFDGITQEASASSSTVMKKGPWDVFINHRGCDTKHKLASSIYHTLDLLGLHAFLDEKELDLGDTIAEEIEEAMRTAGLHVAVFSKNYAESPWCLSELAFMLETGTPIIPVFYHVDPTDLRRVAQGKGCYAHAFSQHEEKGRYPLSKLEEWKKALERVSTLSGHILNDNNGDEGMLLKSIVNSVLRVVKKEPLEVAKHPVGMDEIVQDFERSRHEYVETEEHLQIVGIIGFGGSGKTTLAKEIYNRKSSSFHRSSFVHDVRDAASKNSLHAKQNKLLKDLRIQADPFDNKEEGKRTVEKSLKSLNALIVLDDVDHEDQLDALLPPSRNLKEGSLIIVTTREGGVLANWGIKWTYKMRPLQPIHAKDLFCWHAFLNPYPQEGFEELVEKCLDVCQGLPLSLKVIGGQLYGKRSKDYWASQIEKVRRILPRDVKERLKVSYDALDKEEQEVFLDVACFFIGERISLAIAVWNGSGWSGPCSWETLYNKCLVEVIEVDGEECIRMHDHLRDLGREIAETQPPSRIWSERQSMHSHIQRGMPIRGIMAATANSWKNGFRNLDNRTPFKEYIDMMRISNVTVGLQLLLIVENDFTEECGELSRGLVWLRWPMFKHICIPSWISLDNIRVLELIHASKLEALWDDTHPPLQLRELLIRDALGLQSLPRSVGHLKHLKRVSIMKESQGAMQLSRLPEEFCRLHSLEHLDIIYSELRSLPSNFGDMVKLRHICLRESMHLQMLPESFRKLIHLEYLDLSLCFELILESDILKNMTNLKFFDVSGCRKLQVLPHNITNQGSLKNLNFRETSSLRELPANIGQLNRLEELIICDCPLLTRLPTSLGNLSRLTNLTILHCEKLYEIPSLASLVSLKALRVCNCPEIVKIEGLKHLTSLEELVVSTNGMLSGIHSLPGSERLQTVNLQAANISTFQSCIQSIEIEKWPWEMTVCGRIFSGFVSMFDLFTFPGLTAVESFVYPIKRWTLTFPQTSLSNVAVLCFLVPSFGTSDVNADEELFDGIGSYGEMVVIRVLREVSPIFDEGWHFPASTAVEDNLSGPFGGWLIVGEIGSVVKGLKQLFQTLS